MAITATPVALRRQSVSRDESRQLTPLNWNQKRLSRRPLRKLDASPANHPPTHLRSHFSTPTSGCRLKSENVPGRCVITFARLPRSRIYFPPRRWCCLFGGCLSGLVWLLGHLSWNMNHLPPRSSFQGVVGGGRRAHEQMVMRDGNRPDMTKRMLNRKNLKNGIRNIWKEHCLEVGFWM